MFAKGDFVLTDTTQKLENKILSENENDFDELINDFNDKIVDMTLSDYLHDLLSKYNLTKKEIFANAGIDPVYGYQIFNGTKKKPSRDLLLLLAFSFPLSIDETRHLLYYGHCEDLYARNRRDAYIMFSLHNKYPLIKTNIYLAKNDLKPIC